MSIEEAKKYLTDEMKDKILELSGVSPTALYKVLSGEHKSSKCVKYILHFAELEKERVEEEVKENFPY